MAFRITDDCTSCAECTSHCPTVAILRDTHGVYRIDAARCIACGTCSMVCVARAAVDEHGLALPLLVQPPAARHRHAQVFAPLCDGCGACVSSCLFDAIRIEGSLATVIAARCTGCTMCELECTRGAIQSVGPMHARRIATG